MQQLADLEAELLEEIAEYTLDPLAYAQRLFPWGAGDLAGYIGSGGTDKRTSLRELCGGVCGGMRRDVDFPKSLKILKP